MKNLNGKQTPNKKTTRKIKVYRKCDITSINQHGERGKIMNHIKNTRQTKIKLSKIIYYLTGFIVDM